MATQTATQTAQEELAELQAERGRLEKAGASFAELAANSARIRELVFLAAGMGVSGTAGAVKAEPPAGAEGESEGVITFDQVPPATAGQRAFLTELIKGNIAHCEWGCCPPPPEDVTDEMAETLAYVAGAARREVELTAVIDEALMILVDHRTARLGALDTHDSEPPAPTGRHQVDNGLYRVEVVTDGPWAGTIGLYKITDQAGVPGAKITGKRKREVLDAIGVDAVATLRGYGLATGRCGCCDHDLLGLSARYGAHAGCLARF